MKSRVCTHTAQNLNHFHLPHKIAAGALSVLLATTFMCPSIALAADSLWINDASYIWNSENKDGYSGEGWEWKEQDNLNLNGYNGSGICAKGDLNIQVSGENTITTFKETKPGSWGYEDGIAVTEGNLSISGDGDLSINAGYDGIYVNEGDLTIEDTNLTIVAGSANPEYARGIYVCGDIEINNAVVAVEGTAKGIYSIGDYGIEEEESIYGYEGGHIAIKDSDIKVNLTGSAVDGEIADGNGIMAKTSECKTPASITIDGSNVFINAIHAAVLAMNYGYLPASQAANLEGGTIAITNSKIQTPLGAQICNFLIKESYLEHPTGNEDEFKIYKGQTIGFGKEVIDDVSSNAICADANIVVHKTADTPGAFDTTGTSATIANTSLMPKTGDSAGILATVAGVALVIAGAVLTLTRIRKRA